MNLLSSDLLRFTTRHNLSAQLSAARIVGVANQVAAGRYIAISFRQGRLAVTVPTHSARYRIQTKLAGIIQQINTELGSGLIQKIVVRITAPNG